MLGSPRKATRNVTQRTTTGYIGPKLVIRGRLSGAGELQIDGKVEGDIVVDGVVDVGESGVVMATVEAERVSVGGRVRGPVLASEEVVVRAGGRLEGEVRAPRVGIDDGGELHGGIDMDFDLDPPGGWEDA